MGLTKRYGQHVAVDRVDFEVPAGVVSGFVGPNGAGKTTTIRMLLGLIRPSEGAAEVLGQTISDPPGYLARVGAWHRIHSHHPNALSRTAAGASSPGREVVRVVRGQRIVEANACALQCSAR